jgi:hypothetical protein
MVVAMANMPAGVSRLIVIVLHSSNRQLVHYYCATIVVTCL